MNADLVSLIVVAVVMVAGYWPCRWLARDLVRGMRRRGE